MKTDLKEVKNSLAKKLLINFLIICTISGMILSVLYYHHARYHVWKLFSKVSTSCAIAGANILHDAPINDFLNGQKKELYQFYNEELKNIAESFKLKYLYIYVPDLENDRLIPVFGIDGKTGKSIENFNLGEPVKNLKLNSKVVNMYKNKQKQLVLEMNNEFGHVFTGYSTITDKNGEPIAIIGADIDYHYIMVKIIKDCASFFVFITFVLLILYFSGIFYIQKTFIRPILHLSTELSSYSTQNNETKPITLSTDDELNIIANLCNGMALEKKRIENELNIAKKIQLSALPMVFPPFPNSTEFDIFADLSTAKEVGGDFYDFFYVGPNRFVFLIADVCGKGVPAALFMMQAKSLLTNILQTGMALDKAITKVNKKICENNKESYFITAFIAGIDLNTGEIAFVNCGHNEPLIKRNDGDFEYIKTERNIVLGLMDDYKYKKTVDKLNKDDLMFLYTDGVTEAMNEEEKLYGEERLKTALNNTKDAKIEDIIANIERNVAEFSQNTEQSDDITTLIFKYNGKENI